MKKYCLICLLAIAGSAFAMSSQAAEKVSGKPTLSLTAAKNGKKHKHGHKHGKHKHKGSKTSKSS